MLHMIFSEISRSVQALSHIDDDVLVLWASALKNTLSIDAINGAPGLRELFPLAVQLLARVEQAEKANDIIYSYFLFDASGFLQVVFYKIMCDFLLTDLARDMRCNFSKPTKRVSKLAPSPTR